jgi:hypothetical protein
MNPWQSSGVMLRSALWIATSGSSVATKARLRRSQDFIFPKTCSIC